ncbi:MAG: hypothetical protein K2Q14_08475 [Gammaproteobacteria bacterium]|nr:hypothetical protein [Gammaproteobacteria bacterium]
MSKKRAGKAIAYTSAGLMGFIGSYAPLFSLLTSVLAAFAVSALFPPITLVAFLFAVGLGLVVGTRNILKARKEQKFIDDLENRLDAELNKKARLEEKQAENTKTLDGLIISIDAALTNDTQKKNAYNYVEFLFNKIKSLSHNERATFLMTDERSNVLESLSIFENSTSTKEQMNQALDTLKKIIEPKMNATELAQFPQENATRTTNSFKNLHTSQQSKATKPSVSEPKVSLGSSLAMGLKTVVLVFATILSVTAIAASLVFSLPPMALIAAAPLTAVAVSAGVLAFSMGLGTLASVFYHKIVGPQEIHHQELERKITESESENKLLEEKTDAQEEKINSQKFLLHNINEQSNIDQNNLKHKSQSVHNLLDKKSDDSSKIGVEQAMKIAHPKLQKKQMKPDPEAVLKNNKAELPDLSHVVKQLSAAQKEALIEQLKNTPSAEDEAEKRSAPSTPSIGSAGGEAPDDHGN